MLKTLRSLQRMLLLFLSILSLLMTLCGVSFLPIRSTRQRRRLVAGLVQRHLRIIAWISGLRIHVQGPRPARGSTFLLLSNHISYWDIIALGSLFPLGFMAKHSIARWPVIGWVTRLSPTVFVNRDQVHQRWRALRTLQTRLADIPYCVFPEGTTRASAAPDARDWRRGNIAARQDPGVEVWLAGLQYDNQEALAWIDDDALLPHLFKALMAPSIDLHIKLQPLSCPEGAPLAEASTAAYRQTVALCLARS